MHYEIIAALINAAGTIIAASIGVAGVYALFKHRRKVQMLSEQIEAYHHFEGELTREIYRLKNNSELSESSLPSFRGKLRNELVKDEQRPSMTAKEAIKMRNTIL